MAVGVQELAASERVRAGADQAVIDPREIDPSLADPRWVVDDASGEIVEPGQGILGGGERAGKLRPGQRLGN